MRETKGNNGIELRIVKKLAPSDNINGNYGATFTDVDISVSNNEVSSPNGNGPNSLEIQTNNAETEDSDDEDTDCCGRERKKRKSAVGVAELFKFSTTFDKFLMIIGTIGALCQGLIVSFNLVTFGDVIDVFVGDVHNISSSAHSNSTIQSAKSMSDAVLPYIYRFVGFGVGSFICSFLAVGCWKLAAERQINTIRKKFFYAVIQQEVGWFDMNEAAEISSRLSDDINKMVDGMGEGMAMFIQWTATWSAAYIMSFTRSWKLTLAIIIACPLVMFIGAAVVRILKNIVVLEAEAYAKAGAVAEQALRAIRTVHAFHGQEKEIMKYEMNLNDAVRLAAKKGVALGMAKSIIWLILFPLFAGTMCFGTFLIQEENLEPGKLFSVFLGVMIASILLASSFKNIESFSSAQGAATKVFDLIALVPKNDFSVEGLKPSALIGHIEFRNVQFTYPARRDIQVLKDFSLTVEPGQHVALVGPSGCGKSTTVQLLQRFYDVDGGTLLVDGANIKELNLKWLREHIGVVSQEPVLFDASIEENIRFGKIDATETEIQHAAKEANAHDFIKMLPEGYNTKVGERGAQLSGGQKQRISIARALVRNPKILLLDEATSALDQESEVIVQNALEKAGKGRTTITIAHRLSTIKHADKIVAISDGIVVEQGTHDELLKKDGLYNKFIKIQTGIGKKSENDNVDDMDVEEYNEYETSIKDAQKPPYNQTVSVLSSESAQKKQNFVRRVSLHNKDKEASTQDTELESLDTTTDDVNFFKIINYSAPEWQLIVLGCFSSVLTGAITPAFSFLISEFMKLISITDRSEQWEKISILAGCVTGLGVISFLFRVLQEYGFSKSGASLTAHLRKLTFTSMIYQDMEYFDLPSNQVGALTTRLAGDAAMVQVATGSKIGQILEAASTIICALVIAFISGWKLSLVVMCLLPLIISTGVAQGNVIRDIARKDREQMELAGKICSEVVDGIRTVVSLSREDFFIKKFNELIDYTIALKKRMSLIFGVTYGTINGLNFFAYAIAFYYGSTLVSDGEMEFFEIFRVFSAIVFGADSISHHFSFGVDYTKAKLAAARIIDLINKKPKIDVREENGQTIADFKGSINLINVKFQYPTRPNTTVLDDMNLTISQGETVALVGASGCGKSTTTQLVERFYDVHDGALLADGQDIRKLNLKWYRKQLGIVSQEPTLFDCSIAENIAYGDTSRVVPMAEIIQAARDANIHNFVSNLPQGYDTNVGEKGTQLSGGQKQRIAIARALVRNPKILLFDEATSALDSESEKIVQEALDKASENRTCITIAQRLSTIQNADKIAVVSKCRIIETGTHSQLVTLKGAYYRLLQAQNRSHNDQSG